MKTPTSLSLTAWILTVFLCSITTAQIGPDPRWLNPNGSLSDLSTTFKLSQSVTIAWSTLNASLSDLYWTNWGSNSTFYVKVASNVDISKPGTLNYVFNTDDSTLRQYNYQFVLRFWPRGEAFGPLQFRQAISPGFRLERDDSASRSTSAATASSTPTSTSASSLASTSASTITSTANAATSSASSSGVATVSDSSSSLSGGAKAGIAIGAILGVALLVGIGWFLGRRYRRNPTSTKAQDDSKESISSPVYASKPVERNQYDYRKAAPTLPELPGQGSYRVEVSGESENPKRIHELA